MFSERAVTDETRELAEDRFFKRNGAKKDPAWNDRNKPEEVRAKWVEMMNGAMQKAGIDQQLDPRSWAEQGREDLAALREEKTLQGHGREARERNEEIDILRELRAELPAAGLDREATIALVEKLGERQMAVVQEREQQELSRIDKLIAAARERVDEVKKRAVAAARSVADRMDQFRGRFEQWNDRENKPRSVQTLDTETLSRAPASQELGRAAPELTVDTQTERRLEAFRERLEAYEQAREPVATPAPAIVPESPAVQQKAVEKEPEQEQNIECHGFGFGIEM